MRAFACRSRPPPSAAPPSSSARGNAPPEPFDIAASAMVPTGDLYLVLVSDACVLTCAWYCTTLLRMTVGARLRSEPRRNPDGSTARPGRPLPRDRGVDRRAGPQRVRPGVIPPASPAGTSHRPRQSPASWDAVPSPVQQQQPPHPPSAPRSGFHGFQHFVINYSESIPARFWAYDLSSGIRIPRAVDATAGFYGIQSK